MKPQLSVLLAASQQVEQTLGGVEPRQRPRRVCGRTDVTEPGAAGLGELLDVGPAVAGVDERQLEVAALAVVPWTRMTCVRPGRSHCRFHAETTGVALGLADLAGH